MNATPWTSEQITEGIAAAIKRHDFDAVEGLLKLLAVRDPGQAQAVYDSIMVGLAIGMAHDAGR